VYEACFKMAMVSKQVKSIASLHFLSRKVVGKAETIVLSERYRIDIFVVSDVGAKMWGWHFGSKRC